MKLGFLSVYADLRHFCETREKSLLVDEKGILTKRNKKSALLTDLEKIKEHTLLQFFLQKNISRETTLKFPKR